MEIFVPLLLGFLICRVEVVIYPIADVFDDEFECGHPLVADHPTEPLVDGVHPVGDDLL